MKYLYVLTLASLVSASTAAAQEITVPQPVFPEPAQEKQLEFTPPTALGELVPSTDVVAAEKKLTSNNRNPVEAPIVLGKNGELVIIKTAKSE